MIMIMNELIFQGIYKNNIINFYFNKVIYIISFIKINLEGLWHFIYISYVKKVRGDSMSDKGNIGIFSWFGYVMSMQERLELIKKAGFDGVTIWWEDEIGYSDGKKENFPKLVKDNGLIFENIHAPFTNPNLLWSSFEYERRSEIDKYVEWIEDCARYNIPVMVMHVIEGSDYPEPNEYGLTSINEIVKKAEKSGVKIAIENTMAMSNLPYIFKRIQSPNLVMCYDSSHDRLHRNSLDLLKSYGNKLGATHISDNDGLKDRHWLPGNGDIDWYKIGEVFPSQSYQGFITLEVYPNEEELKTSPEAFLAKAYQRALYAESRLNSNVL